ncbi:nucleotide di-P-sugar epimerase or dehydratase (plasmid) [Pseudovibrio sp. FO-BEG1]|uniref:GDP-L-fucose synthase n=1 Tax=Pseudovibrio sp. (strain FO-BEG1) TaxID=911045 RepID=UPI000238D0AD|nr:GDP-L-fucose synthase [Pseudovibrio sp. FO-BEG1]AEV39853.1 nucleotide di-P-sugar epimerase or dehydratase [Pseudovibrio sp. FO-BEG1]
MPDLSETKFDLVGKTVFVTGHKGMVGGALMRRLEREDCSLLTADRKQVDLTAQSETLMFLQDTKPDAVIVAAAKVGGIWANNEYPADFLYENLAIETNLIRGAYAANVQKLLFLGSSCIYPKHAPQPISEEALLSGPLEPTNEWYAIAKIAGIKLCQAFRKQHGCDFISAMPTNLYGPGDNFDLTTSHVLPALMRKVHEAKASGASSFEIWGTGAPRREFLHCDDCADALVYLLKNYSADEHINVGFGTDISILGLAEKIASILGFEGSIETDTTKPDGTPRKLMSSERLVQLGWKPSISLDEGIAETYNWFLQHHLEKATA